MSKYTTHKASLNLRLIETKQELLSALSRTKLADCLAVAEEAQQAIDQSKAVLRLIDSPHAIWHMPASDIFCIEHQELNAFELSFVLTSFISTMEYSIIVLDGYLADLSFYLPRLRWILSHYQCRLILLQD